MKLLLIDTTACDGSNVFWIWLFWLLLAFVLGFIIAWLLKRRCNKSAKGTGTKQDLKLVEGIGPKIEELLNKKGISNYRQLSDSSVDELEAIIEEAGPAFYSHRHLALTWPAQAKLAQFDQFEELEKWQGLLKRGV